MQLVLYRNASEIACNGCAQMFAKGSDLGHRAALPDAIPNTEQGALRPIQGTGDFLHVAIRRVAGPKVRNAAFDYVGCHLLGAQQPVVDGEMHRADRRRFRDHQGAINGLREPLGLDHRPGRLGKRRGDRRGAKAMTEIKANPVGIAPCVTGEGNDHDGQAAGPDG